MKQNKLIASRTKFSVFRNVFTHGKLNEKIEWCGEINQLQFFINTLLEKVPAYKHIRNKQKWKITVNSFILKDKKAITTTQLKSTKKPIDNKKTPIYEAIEPFLRMK